MKKLEDGVKELFTSENHQKYLRTLSQFQREPVSGEPETGTESDPDQKTHLYFKTATVFDISSTDGEPLPTIGVDELTGTSEGYKALMKALATVSSVPFQFDEIEGGAKGYYHNVNKEIVIQ